MNKLCQQQVSGGGTRSHSKACVSTLLSKVFMHSVWSLEYERLDFVVQDQHKCTSGTSKDIRKGSLEEGSTAFSLVYLAPAVYGVLVHEILLRPTALHHHSPSDSVERVRHDARHSSHSLGDHPRDDNGSVLGVRKHALSSVKEAKVGRSVDYDALYRHIEATVQPHETIRLEDLRKTVAQSSELPLSCTLADVCSQPGSGEVQRVDEAQGSGTSRASGGQIAGKVAPELGLLVDTTEEDLLVLVLEGEVQRLSGEVSDHIGKVATPETEEALFLGDSDKAVDHAFVALGFRDLLGGMLHLEQKLDSLDGRDSRLGNSRGDATGDEILRE